LEKRAGADPAGLPALFILKIETVRHECFVGIFTAGKAFVLFWGYEILFF